MGSCECGCRAHPSHYYRIAYRRAALDDPPAHDPNVVDGSAADNDPQRKCPPCGPVQGNGPQGSVVRAYPKDSGLRRLTHPRARLRVEGTGSISSAHIGRRPEWNFTPPIPPTTPRPAARRSARQHPASRADSHICAIIASHAAGCSHGRTPGASSRCCVPLDHFDRLATKCLFGTRGCAFCCSVRWRATLADCRPLECAQGARWRVRHSGLAAPVRP